MLLIVGCLALLALGVSSVRTGALLGQSDRFGHWATLVLVGLTVLCFFLSHLSTRTLLTQIRERDAERLAAQATLERRVEERTVALREAQQQAARDHHRFKFIFDSLPVGVTWVLNGNDATRIGNPAYARISGVSQEQGRVPGAYGLVTHPDDRASQAVLHRQLAAGEIDHYQIEKRYVRPDGSFCPAELTIRIFRDPVTGETQEIGMLTDLTERKRSQQELEKMHHQLVDASLHAGMAEVATGVLHNIGNVLNSVNVSAAVVTENLRRSKAANLAKLSALLEEHSADLATFITTDPKGARIPRYLGQLATELAAERQSSVNELSLLQKNIEHIKDIVSTQQTYAKVSGLVESVSVSSLVEDSLRMNASALVRHGLEVVRDFQADPVISTERHKILQILINLIRNAKYACDDSNKPDKRVTLRILEHAGRVQIIVADNGVGIPAENLTRIFSHGFTTRRDGHGFGLHSGALAARELGGTLTAQSDGPGLGAVFTLELPGPDSLSLTHERAA
jgi:PAS domain S-box-containing protein